MFWMCPGCQARCQALCCHGGFPALPELPIWWVLEKKGVYTWLCFLQHHEEVLTFSDKGQLASFLSGRPEINTQTVPPIRP